MFGNEEKKRSFDTMLRLDCKAQLVEDASKVFESLAEKRDVYFSCKKYGRKFFNKSLRSVYLDFNKGLKYSSVC